LCRLTQSRSLSSPSWQGAVDSAEHCLGPSTAQVTIVEYGDFECPNCKQAAPATKLLLARFTGRVRLVWRHFPMEEVHPHALQAALASEAAASQKKFWPMHDLLFDDQRQLALPRLRSYAVRLRLDVARYEDDMRGDLCMQRVRKDIDSGRASGVRATPTFFVNGVLQDVSYGLQPLFDRTGYALSDEQASRRFI
jgi:protein-disulfide isomerase